MMVIVSAIKLSSQRPSGLQKHGSDTHEISAVDMTLLAEGASFVNCLSWRHENTTVHTYTSAPQDKVGRHPSSTHTMMMYKGDGLLPHLQ